MSPADKKLFELSELKKNILIAAGLFLFTLVSRLLFAEHYFYDTDTVGFALGSGSYSLEQTRPHMPGYYLHVNIIRLLNFFTASPHISAILLSILYTSLGIAFVYFFFLKYFEAKTAFLTSLLLITNPLVWYYGCTTDIYIYDLFFTSVFILLGTSKKWIYYLPVFAAVSLGVRPSSGVFLFPLYCYLWYAHNKKEAVAVRRFSVMHIISIFILLAWFIPMASTAGSIGKYFLLFKTNNPMPNISILQNIFQFTSYLFWFAIPFFLLILFLIISGKIKIVFNLLSEFFKANKLFLFWLIPPVILFLFYNYAKGWLIIIAVPVFICFGILKEKGIITNTFLIFIIAVQSIVFIFLPKQENKIEGWFNTNHRNQSLFTTWYNRTFSVYSMTYAKINEQDQILGSLTGLVDSLSGDRTYNGKTLFMDPYYYSYARPLQYLFPSIKFVTLDFDNKDAYIEYKGMNIQRKDGLKEVIQNSGLITNAKFYRKYLKGIEKGSVFKSSPLLYLQIDETNIDILSYIYSKYFIRELK